MLDDTIAAISTPLGEGGIGIVRISGKDALGIASRIFTSVSGKDIRTVGSHTIHYGYIKDPKTGKTIDEVMLSVMLSPKTYTKEDVVEINCHGGILPLKKVLELVLEYGARLAEPGEFTKRAFLNGRIDLSQAEAVIDIIRAKTDIGLSVALNHLGGGISDKINPLEDKLLKVLAHIEASIDFPEHDIEELTVEEVKKELNYAITEIENMLKTAEKGKILREGLNTIIAGKPNVGKSSLLNALLREKKAIVTDIPGTTRDVIEDYVNIRGIPLKIMDTAGIRETNDLVERIGVERSLELFEKAELVLFVLDASKKFSKEDELIAEKIKNKNTIVLINKTDLPLKLEELKVKQMFEGKKVIKISVKENRGLDELETAIEKMFLAGEIDFNNDTIISSIRHKNLLKEAERSIKQALSTIDAKMPLDIVSIDINEALTHLGEITGKTISEDVIDRIFHDFCIGK
ncbi:MAG: tRNA modification GTPase [Thermosediminibacterales bacterium]|nr:tRNA modification GTPase [Thermosediminibacterales bacterium]MDK2835700.1 tRNA modification GTPase [Thermosediminibacterales bacterium]